MLVFFEVLHNYRAICCKMGYRTDASAGERQSIAQKGVRAIMGEKRFKRS